jgi:hypothetical protein
MRNFQGQGQTQVVLFNFENAEQLKEKLDSLVDFNIMSIVPMKYKAAEMGESEKLVSVIIIYQ